ncbi:hypothetical protein H2198_000847 [Neophaeococcomyces mojaviensis]|uniref:Uncharacterized protein n=1 Tax=Neophaeococcomyces mojaviensis TaxID=3383035 RepID=A0ACC3AIK9_9EURO|nr:hypothetical protein H2198_000847 [Knufia sp. JES_112]
MKALVLDSFDSKPTIKEVSIPQATAGSAVVQIQAANILAYAGELFSGKLQYPLSLPGTIGGSAIGRITDVGPDATTLKVGDLVFMDSFIRGRDNPAESILFGTHGGITPESRKLMDEEWRNSTYAEFAKVPLENCHRINEDVLCKELGYTVEDLAYVLRLTVPMGGLYELDIKAGETVVIAPATGAFGGAAVEVAVAMGATVIAAARNATMLEKLSSIGGGGQVKTVQLSGDPTKDAASLGSFGPIDAYLDFSPSAAAKSTHILACLLALKTGGRACFMGGIQDPVAIPYGLLMFKSLKLQGKFMYERAAVARLIKLVEKGKLVLGERAGLRCAGTFGLQDWEQAFEAAAKSAGWGEQVLMSPNKLAM